jgi:hypothetical protein
LQTEAAKDETWRVSAKPCPALLAIAFALMTVSAASSANSKSGAERFDGGLVVSGASGKRTVAGSAVAMSGVFSGVGRIVERPNKPGDSAKVDRDDLVFAAGTMHIKSTMGHASFGVDKRTCTATFKIAKTTTVEGGTGRFAGASGRFAGNVSGSAVAGRNADGSCDQQHAAVVEIDTVTGTGTLTF